MPVITFSFIKCTLIVFSLSFASIALMILSNNTIQLPLIGVPSSPSLWPILQSTSSTIQSIYSYVSPDSRQACTHLPFPCFFRAFWIPHIYQSITKILASPSHRFPYLIVSDVNRYEPAQHPAIVYPFRHCLV